MKHGKVLGFTKYSEHKPASTDKWQDHDEGFTKYTFYIDVHGEAFTISVEDSYGSCSSGYCEATWGDTDNELMKSTGMIPPLIKPIKELIVEIVPQSGALYDAVIVSRKDNDKWYDAIVSSIKSIDGDIITTDTGDGGCCYYPSGNATVNLELFESIEDNN